MCHDDVMWLTVGNERIHQMELLKEGYKTFSKSYFESLLIELVSIWFHNDLNVECIVMITDSKIG